MKPVIAGGLILIAVGAAGALVVQTAAEVVPLLVIAGIGNGCYNVLSWPLLTTLIPAERVGVFAGLKSSAESLSAFFSSFLAAGMVALWGYRSIFLILLVAVAASLVALNAVSEGESGDMIDPALEPAPAVGTQPPRGRPSTPAAVPCEEPAGSEHPYHEVGRVSTLGMPWS